MGAAPFLYTIKQQPSAQLEGPTKSDTRDYSHNTRHSTLLGMITFEYDRYNDAHPKCRHTSQHNRCLCCHSDLCTNQSAPASLCTVAVVMSNDALRAT